LHCKGTRPTLTDHMKTFEALYCEAAGCAPTEFRNRVFWQCLHRHALPVAPVILFFNRSYFDLDRELLGEVRNAVQMNEVWEEVRQYFVSPKHEGWLRRRANIRISARRLINMAREHLPAAGSPPPISPVRKTQY
jgi:hypothetical protein